MGKTFKITLSVFVVLATALFAVEVFSLPKVTPELKAGAQEYYNNECKACHRWGRKFAAPPMKENVAQYAEKPEEMVKYLMHPTPKHPDIWPAMEITPLTEDQAKMMTAWLLYILDNPEDPGRPK
ncbi:MAG: c-type cytochrome [Fibrobacter sp.]|jgi:cytochrome c551/c552|nr:c-type cytochrome [Fibrobacter sp.]MBR2469140.1 c-type cytochrome [Fibrobacter sp.]